MSLKNNKLVKSLIALALVGFASTASAEWKYGIGSGLAGLAIKGDMSIGTQTQFGTITIPADLSASDIRDYTDSAIGFAGYVTDGNLFITYGYLNLNLEDTLTANLLGTKIKFDVSNLYTRVAYPIYNAGNLKLSVLGGVSYTAHDLSIKVYPAANKDNSAKVNYDNGWLDVEAGLSADVKLAPKWNWSSTVKTSFGQSEGTYSLSTGINWTFAKNWTTGLSYAYSDVEFQENDSNDADYYNYDMEETVISLSLLYHF